MEQDAIMDFFLCFIACLLTNHNFPKYLCKVWMHAVRHKSEARLCPTAGVSILFHLSRNLWLTARAITVADVRVIPRASFEPPSILSCLSHSLVLGYMSIWEPLTACISICGGWCPVKSIFILSNHNFLHDDLPLTWPFRFSSSIPVTTVTEWCI